MGSTVRAESAYDTTDLPHVVRCAVRLAVFEAVIVVALSFITRFLSGPVEFALGALVLVAGITVVTFLPGRWTNARTIEGIAGAAGIGLTAAVVFLVIDVSVLQPLGMYTNRWRQIGGGSNWWYHPVWWMAGTFLPWMGAWILANQMAKGRQVSPVIGFATALGIGVLVAGLAVLLGFPGAHWTLATFAVAFLPGVVLAMLVSAIGDRQA
jgi:hypothetical protein